MKVAIIGAGISGLSCAIELQRHGIKPTIFEKTKTLGDKPGNLVATLRMFHRSLRNPIITQILIQWKLLKFKGFSLLLE